MKHIVCLSGGESSALVAVEVVRKYGPAEVVLLNHDINPSVEDADIKRFKLEVSQYLKIPITYANYQDLPGDQLPDQFDVVVKIKAFKVGKGTELCTAKLKTEPFMNYLKKHFPTKDCIIYYGFDQSELHRVQRRIGIMGGEYGYATAYPLVHWKRTIQSIRELGIEPPMGYSTFKHANCMGCLKAGKQHWYLVYQHRKDIFDKGKWAESQIGYTIDKDESLEELEPKFEEAIRLGLVTTEHEDPRTFWARVRKARINMVPDDGDMKPCECTL